MKSPNDDFLTKNDSKNFKSNEFIGRFLVQIEGIFYFLKYLSSFEIQLICKYFNFNYGEYSEN